MFAMMKECVCVGLSLLAVLAVAPAPSKAASVADTTTYQSPRLAVLARALSDGKADALSSFWTEMQGKTPLVERLPGNDGRLAVTYLWKGDDKTTIVTLWGGFPGANLVKPMQRMADSDLWYLTETHPSDARFEYTFQVNGPSELPFNRDGIMKAIQEHPPRLDPLNPRQFEGQSYVELPDAPKQPWIDPRPETPHGTLMQRTFKSEILNAEYPLTVYVPPASAAAKKKPWLMIAFDGGFPLMENTLDNLLAAGKIPPIVVVGVGNISEETRNRDLDGSDAFARFLAEELVPWARKNYPVYAGPSHTIVEGISLGGLMAVYCGLKRSGTFGKVLAQSPTLVIVPGRIDPNPVWNPESAGTMTRRFIESPRLPVEFYLEAGRYEVYLPFSLLAETRRLRDTLEAKGYRVTYSEFDGGHNGVCWRGSIADALIALTGNRKS